MQKQFDGCHLDADITNTSSNVAYTPTVKALIAAANGLESTTVTNQYHVNLPAGDTWTFDYRIELVPLTTTPDYVTVTVLQAGQTIGQGQTSPFAIACP